MSLVKDTIKEVRINGLCEHQYMEYMFFIAKNSIPGNWTLDINSPDSTDPDDYLFIEKPTTHT